MIKAIAIGTSHGGIQAIKTIVAALPPDFKIPIFIVLHIGRNSNISFIEILRKLTGLTIKEAEEKEKIEQHTIYFAPPNYHLQVEDNFTLSLSTAGKVNFSRPSIDILFETAGWAYGDKLLGVLLTGANNDGANGLGCIKFRGGATIVENPKTARAPEMPASAIRLCTPDFILDLNDIGKKIVELSG